MLCKGDYFDKLSDKSMKRYFQKQLGGEFYDVPKLCQVYFRSLVRYAWQIKYLNLFSSKFDGPFIIQYHCRVIEAGRQLAWLLYSRMKTGSNSRHHLDVKPILSLHMRVVDTSPRNGCRGGEEQPASKRTTIGRKGQQCPIPIILKHSVEHWYNEDALLYRDCV